MRTMGVTLPEISTIHLHDSMVDYPDTTKEEDTVELSLETSIMVEHMSMSSLAGEADLPPAWAWADATTHKIKENLVNVMCGQSVRSDIEQITFKTSLGLAVYLC